MPNNLLSIVFMLSSTLSLSLSGLLGKHLVGYLTSPTLTFLRFVIPGLLLLLFFGAKARTFPGPYWRYCLSRAFCMAASHGCFLTSLQELTLVESVVLFSTGPIFIPVLEKLLYRVKFQWITLLALFGAFTGVLLLSGATNEAINLRPELGLGLLSGLFNAGAQINLHKLSKSGLSPYAINLWSLCFAGIILAPLVMLFPMPTSALSFDPALIAGVLVLGLTVINTQVSRLKAYSLVTNSSHLSPLMFTNLLFTAIWQASFFDVSFSLTQIAGVLLIVVSSSLTPLRQLLQWMEKKKQPLVS